MKSDLVELLSKIDGVLSDDQISIEAFKVALEKRTNLWEDLYNTYIDYRVLQYHPDETIDSTIPVIVKYSKKRLWFLNDLLVSTNLRDSQVVAFKNGINIVVEKGSYLEAGRISNEDILTQVSKDKNQSLKSLVYLVNPTRYSSNENTRFIFYNGDSILNNTERQVIRFYFHLRPVASNVKELINDLRNKLNSRQIPFTFKLPFELKDFGRRDTLVLYVYQSHFFLIYDIIRDVHEKYSGENDIIMKGIPLFTKELFSGISLAEDPMTLESFGKSRCKLVCEILDAQTSKTVSIERCLAIFQEKGFSNGLFRSPFTNFDYNFKEVKAHEKNSTFRVLSSGYYAYENYNKIALQYSLDLLENAMWDSNNNFFWASYAEKEGRGFYEILNDENEGIKIYWFLFQVLRIKRNRTYFSSNVINVIENKFSKISYEPSRLRELLLDNSREFLKTFLLEKSSSFTNFNKDFESSIEKLVTQFEKRDMENLSKSKKSWYKFLNDPFPRINYADLYADNINYESKEAKEIAKGLFVLIDKQYPIPNQFSNYEYCPTFMGSLKIAEWMLYTYCPTLNLKKNIPQ